MKTSLLALSLLSVAIATSCDRNDPADTPAAVEAAGAPAPASATDQATTTQGDATTQADATAAADAAAASPATDDALALGLLSAVDDHEIKTAQQAYAKNVTGPVLEYARMMEKQHGDNLAKSKSLGPLGDSAEVQAMKEKAAGERAELDRKSGKEYEKAYIDAMVKGHTEVLSLIDGRLLSLASPGTIRDHLSKARDHVATHLQEAQKLQAANTR